MKEENEQPPFLSSWNRIYAVVIISLVLIIMGLYFLTQYFR